MDNQEYIYNVDLNWKKDRIGILSSEELPTQIEVATPPEFEGGIEGVWSPEHLFISSVSSCFMTTFIAIAKYSKLEFENLEVKATGMLGKPDGKFAVTEIILKPTLVIKDDNQADKALRIMEKAEAACLISRSIKTEVRLEAEVVVGEMG